MGTMKWQPAWWDDSSMSGWERAKEALRRDWEQTRHDLHIAGGHQLNQSASDTVKQASGKEPIPADDAPIPPRIIGDWNDIELPVEYGYGARSKYGKQHTAWSRDLEGTLQREWESGRAVTGRDWNEVREHVRRGYEYRG
jgi:hypothetical protein